MKCLTKSQFYLYFSRRSSYSYPINDKTKLEVYNRVVNFRPFLAPKNN